MDINQIETLEDLKEVAKIKLTSDTFRYIEAGAGNEETVQDNKKALCKIKIRPRVARDVSERTMERSILGHKVAMPIGLAPSIMHKLYHPDGELATAEACNSFPTVLTISFCSSFTVTEIMKAFPSVICFQQIYITNPKSVVENIVAKAKKCNVKALVVTLGHADGKRKLKNVKKEFFNQFVQRYGNKEFVDLLQSFERNASVFRHCSQTWEDFLWLKSITDLPVIAKGILTAEDAVQAIKYGVDAIWVSNNGGRYLDCSVATIDALPEIITAVSGRCEVYVDGGIYTGTDVFKAVALGANMVFIGRPLMYGLACGGSNGVKKVLDIMKSDLDNTMALTGCRNLAEINQTMIKDGKC